MFYSNQAFAQGALNPFRMPARVENRCNHGLFSDDTIVQDVWKLSQIDTVKIFEDNGMRDDAVPNLTNRFFESGFKASGSSTRGKRFVIGLSIG
jgi:hypothetical protein